MPIYLHWCNRGARGTQVLRGSIELVLEGELVRVLEDGRPVGGYLASTTFFVYA